MPQTDFINSQGRQTTVTPANPLPMTAGLSVPAHDYIGLTYTGSNLTGVVYKTGGSGGTTVGTLVLTYDGSDNLLTVTRS